MSNSQSFYSEEEAQKILSVASRNQISNGMSRDELIRAAGELGISAESIEQAEAEIQRQRAAELQEQEEKTMRARYRRHLRNKILGSFSGYIGFVALFVAIWALSGGGHFWPIWVIIWPMIGVVHEIGELLRPEKGYERWRAKQANPDLADEDEEDEDFRRRRRDRVRVYGGGRRERRF